MPSLAVVAGIRTPSAKALTALTHVSIEGRGLRCALSEHWRSHYE